MRVLDLFSGIGGFAIGMEMAGHKTVAFCECDDFCQKLLRKRFTMVPIFNDVRKLQYDGTVDIITGGFPCQDISLANSGKMRGLEGEKSGLWSEFYKQIKRHNPSWVIIENSPVLRSKGLDRILYELAQIGYDAEWHCIPATAVDAPHSRDRIWIIAYPISIGNRLSKGQILTGRHFIEYTPERSPEPEVRRVADGVPRQVDRLRTLGNSIVPSIPYVIGMAINDTIKSLPPTTREKE